MVLTINIGNTHTCVGAYTPEGEMLLSAKLSTATRRTADEYRMDLTRILDMEGLSGVPITGAIIGSVVPARTQALLDALSLMTDCRILTVGPGLKSGLAIRLDDPSQLGPEILCAAVAALKTAKPPLVVIAADTALSMTAVDSKGSIRGGVILPGPQAAVSGLVSGTAQLPQVDLSARGAKPSVLASSTAACLRSGAILGTAAMLDGLLLQFEQQLGEPVSVIATGALPTPVLEACHSSIQYQPHLILDGMFSIWKKNSFR